VIGKYSFNVQPRAIIANLSNLTNPGGSNGYRYQDDQGRSFDGGFDTKAKELEAYVGTNVNYAAGIEARLNFLNHAKNYMALAYPTFCKKYTKEYFTNVKLPK